jgi:hypothetical protein
MKQCHLSYGFRGLEMIFPENPERNVSGNLGEKYSFGREVCLKIHIIQTSKKKI